MAVRPRLVPAVSLSYLHITQGQPTCFFLSTACALPRRHIRPFAWPITALPWFTACSSTRLHLDLEMEACLINACQCPAYHAPDSECLEELQS